MATGNLSISQDGTDIITHNLYATRVLTKYFNVQ